MRLCYFYASDFPEAVAALPSWAEKVDTSADNFAFYHAMKERWGTGEALMTVEQDVIVTPEAIHNLEHCDWHWCSYAAYQRKGKIGKLLYQGFNCTRFSAEMQDTVPFPDKPIPWFLLDAHVRLAIMKYTDYWPDCHGVVDHLHEHRGFEIAGWRIEEDAKGIPIWGWRSDTTLGNP